MLRALAKAMVQAGRDELRLAFAHGWEYRASEHDKIEFVRAMEAYEKGDEATVRSIAETLSDKQLSDLLVALAERRPHSHQWQTMKAARSHALDRLKWIKDEARTGWLTSDEAERVFSEIEQRLSFPVSDPAELGIVGGDRFAEPMTIDTLRRCLLDRCMQVREGMRESEKRGILPGKPPRAREIAHEIERLGEQGDYRRPAEAGERAKVLLGEIEDLEQQTSKPRALRAEIKRRLSVARVDILSRLLKDLRAQKVSSEDAVRLADMWMALDFGPRSCWAVEDIKREAARTVKRDPSAKARKLRDGDCSPSQVRCSRCGQLQGDRDRCTWCDAELE